jgi:hypothetical protein
MWVLPFCLATNTPTWDLAHVPSLFTFSASFNTCDCQGSKGTPSSSASWLTNGPALGSLSGGLCTLGFDEP